MVTNNQISNSARLTPIIKELLKTGRKTIQQLYEVPSVKEITKGSWNVSEAIKQMHKRKEIVKLPHHDPMNLQTKYCYELVKHEVKRPEQIGRRQVPVSVVNQVDRLFIKPTVNVKEHSVTIELERFKITIED